MRLTAPAVGAMPPQIPPPALIPAAQAATVRVKANDALHGSSVAAKPDRTPHPDDPMRDIHGRLLPGAGYKPPATMQPPIKAVAALPSKPSRHGASYGLSAKAAQVAPPPQGPMPGYMP